MISPKFPIESLKVSIRKIQDLNAHLMEYVKFPVESLKVSIGNILMIPNFESSDTKGSKIDGRSRSRTNTQINAYKKNFSKGHSIHWKLHELDTRLRHLQSLVLSMR